MFVTCASTCAQVVVNELLMDNHQTELAEALAKGKFLLWTLCARLPQTLALVPTHSFQASTGVVPLAKWTCH